MQTLFEIAGQVTHLAVKVFLEPLAHMGFVSAQIQIADAKLLKTELARPGLDVLFESGVIQGMAVWCGDPAVYCQP